MIDLVIKKSNKENIEDIAKLYVPNREFLEVEWLLKNQINNDYNSFSLFREDNNKIVGHIGFVKSLYIYNEKVFSSVHMVKWIVLEEYKKSNKGLKLYSTALQESDFSIVIGGTEIANKIYPYFKYKQFVNIKRYRKLINLMDYLKNFDGNKLSILKYFKDYLKNIMLNKTIHNNCYARLNELKMLSADDLNKFSSKDKLDNFFNQEKLDWIDNCYNSEVKYYEIVQDMTIGYMIVFLKNSTQDKSATIVYINDLNSENLFQGVLYELEKILKKYGINRITTFSSNEKLCNALELSYYTPMDSMPFWIRNKVKDLIVDEKIKFHYMPLEADHLYRM